MWAGPSEAVPLKSGDVRMILALPSSQPLEGRKSGFWIDVRARWLRILAWMGYKPSRALLIHAGLGGLL